MAFTETACFKEKKLVSLLENAGFAVVDHRREKLDLSLTIEREGISGQVRFLGGVTAAKGVIAEPDPKVVRIDLGEPSDEPTSWSFWSHTHEEQRGKYRSYYFAGVQAAIGPGWSSVAMGSTTLAVFAKLLIAHVEALKPSEADDDRTKYLAKHPIDAPEPTSKSRGRNPLGLLLVIPFFVALATFVLWNEPVGSPQFWAFGGLCAFFSLVFGGLGLLLWRLGKRTRPIAGGTTSVVEDLQGCGAFESVEEAPLAPSTSTQVIVSGELGLAVEFAEIGVKTIRASSTRHEVRADVRCCEVGWPEGVNPTCQVVPGKWIDIVLEGPEAVLNQLGEAPRLQRSPSRMVVVVTGDEYEGGALDGLLKKLVIAVGSRASPYR